MSPEFNCPLSKFLSLVGLVACLFSEVIKIVSLLYKWTFWSKYILLFLYLFYKEYRGTLVLINSSFWNLWGMPKSMSTKLSWDWSVTSVSLWKRGAKLQASCEWRNIFFSCQNVMSAGFDEFWSQWVTRYVCIKYLHV